MTPRFSFAKKLFAGHRLDLPGGDATRPQQVKLAAFDLDDRRFQPDQRGPAIDDQRYPFAKVGGDGVGGRGADFARRIGAGRGQRAPQPRDQVAAEPSRHSERDRVEACRHQRVDGRSRAQRQHERQRAGPEFLSQPPRQRIEDGDRLRHGHVRDMRDKRVEARAALGFEDAGNRCSVDRVAGQSVHGLGRYRDDVAAGKQSQRPLQRIADFENFRHVSQSDL